MILRLTKKDILTEDTRAYSFEADNKFDFLPGQFVLLKQPGDVQKNARSFSMANAPHAEKITFLMKHLPEGHISGLLAEAPLGTPLEASVPLGRFTLQETDTDRVFVATGTGLAPIMSFIEHAATIQPSDQPPFEILFGCRNEQRLFWTEKLPTTALITLSQPSQTWTGLTGRVTDHIPTVAAEHPDAAWYLCGSAEMIKEVRQQLLERGVEPAQIHFEIY
ncbi:MAG: hypothetical protein A2848_02080 [Candidatus Magasanikbacteria bacterium RIFCSPHIGHO2_01_FULL_50_8]|uniref:FAD-binding FR-type domain-containing protein n=1 Tax=Candidatus Magasanikbacteria bacterium RIFCSPHIGHO2_01_FULL_50_8 TaxID=1798674 RepID=A0A1F6LS59_9BACT|nr:MAG: hypothetical protein A2848_02080 [Candidatus Magasanikbacteria bacterium RIFCSPHIGHO2_01_FULL_50_8]